MDIQIIYKIAAIGLIVAILNIILSKSGRDEMAMLTTLSGVIIVIVMLLDEIKNLFISIQNLLNI